MGELRAEQDHATSLAAAKNSMGNQLGELEGRLADAESAALKGGKASMAKMEMKIRELEAELASTQSRTGEAAKALQRGDRKAKELAFAQGGDRRKGKACHGSVNNSSKTLRFLEVKLEENLSRNVEPLPHPTDSMEEPRKATMNI